MGQFTIEWLNALWMILVESGPYLLVGFLIAGFLSILVPANWIARRLGGDDVKSVATASLIGVPVPLCSCSVIPTATQLRRSGASRGATTSFLISTPETGVDSIGATWALMDPLMTIVRPLAAFVTAFASGVAVNLFGQPDEKDALPLDRASTAPDDLSVEAGLIEAESSAAAPPAAPTATSATESAEGGCCAHTAPAPDAVREETRVSSADGAQSAQPAALPVWRRAMNYAFGTLLDDLAPWFLIGFAISGFIVVAIPDGFFAGALFTGIGAMLAMLIAGVPLYVCATASTPIAAAMMAKGLAPGAALVFLLAGPATNVATILVVRDLLGRRALAIYLMCIAVFSLLIGGLVNRLYPILGLDPTAMQIDPNAMNHGLVAQASGVILGLLLLRSAIRTRVDQRFGSWLRRAGAPLRLDPTSLPFKLAGALAAVTLYASTAATVVAPGTTLFVEQFGRVAQERSEPGLVLHAPWPFAKTSSVQTALVQAERFGFDDDPIGDDVTAALALAAERRKLEELEDEAEVLTGDGNFLAIEYAVQFRITDARAWRYGTSAPRELLRGLSQEVMRRATARRSIDELLVGQNVDLEDEVQRGLTASAARLDLGASIASVELISVHAPSAVHRDYRNVASAQVDSQTQLATAEWKKTQRMTEASNAAADKIMRARSDARRQTSIAQGEADAFARMSEVFRADPEGFRTLMQLDAYRRAFQKAAGNGARHTAVLSPNIDIVQTDGRIGTSRPRRADSSAEQPK